MYGVTSNFCTRVWRRRLRFAVASAALLAGLVAAGRSRGTESLSLFSEGDARQLRLSADDWRNVTAPGKRGQPGGPGPGWDGGAERGVAKPPGPKILIEEPTARSEAEGRVIVTASPTDLSVRFVEVNSVPIDMDSLMITARKGWFSKSLTDLLKPYLQGTRIDAKHVDIPDGRFQIDIEIADARGGATKETYFLVVQ